MISAGKSTTIGKIIENLVAFRPDGEAELSVLYCDCEGTFGSKFIKRFKYLKKDDMIIYKEHILEDLWENVEAMIDAEALDVLILDSISALQSSQEDEKGVDGSTVASLPKLLNKVIKRFYKATEESKLTVIVMNSEYTNIQTFGYGAPTKILKGGGALRLGKSVSLELKKSYSKTNAKIETINGEEMMTEVMIEYTAKKNKLGAPMRTVSTMLNVNREVRQTFKYANDVINYATKFNIINKAGAWFKMTVNGEEKKFQGVDTLNAFVENDVDLYTDLKLACYAHIYQPFEFYFHFDYLKKKLEKENQLLKEDKRWELKYMEDIDDEQKEAGYELLSTPTTIRTRKIDQFLTPLQIEQAQEELGDFYGEERMEQLKKLNFCEQTEEVIKKSKKEKAE